MPYLVDRYWLFVIDYPLWLPVVPARTNKQQRLTNEESNRSIHIPFFQIVRYSPNKHATQRTVYYTVVIRQG